jgi:hypothetical protein
MYQATCSKVTFPITTLTDTKENCYRGIQERGMPGQRYLNRDAWVWMPGQGCLGRDNWVWRPGYGDLYKKRAS